MSYRIKDRGKDNSKRGAKSKTYNDAKPYTKSRWDASSKTTPIKTDKPVCRRHWLCLLYTKMY